MRIAIISHTEHYLKDNTIVGWGPTVKELNYLVKENFVTELVHVAPLHYNEYNSGSLPYNNSKITYIPLKPSGGKGLEKLSILITAPKNIYKIYKAIKDVDVIQFRAPTGIGIYVLPYLRFFVNKKYWVKYAGNWKDVNMPIGNKLQKKWLQNFTTLNTKVTVNGKWKGERNNILAFENPTLDAEDRILGKKIVNEKQIENKINFCFVGALNTHKGVDKIIEAFKTIESDKLGEIHFVGDGNLKLDYQNQAKEIKYPTVFHGFLPKDDIKEVYKKCHFLMLPSKSEGFPKVVSEAMNYGCIPIVSEVSCVNQYIFNAENGFLIYPVNTEELVRNIEKALALAPKEFSKIIDKNYKDASKFTYKHYVDRIKKEVFNIS